MTTLTNSPVTRETTPAAPWWARLARYLLDYWHEVAALRSRAEAAEAEVAKLDAWLIGDRTPGLTVADELLSVTKQYKVAAWRGACLWPDEDGNPDPDDADLLDPEEWWGTVIDALERGEEARKVKP